MKTNLSIKVKRKIRLVNDFQLALRSFYSFDGNYDGFLHSRGSQRGEMLRHSRHTYVVNEQSNYRIDGATRWSLRMLILGLEGH